MKCRNSELAAIKIASLEIGGGATIAARGPDSAIAALVATKLRCIAPMTAAYLTAYLGLSILSGFAKPLLGTKVLGPVNLGFALIALNYLVAWVLAVIYARVSNRVHDALVQRIVAKAEHDGAEP